MDPRAKKNLEQFRKDIKAEQIEKKRVQVRRKLPYYEIMFKNSDEDSNGTNSRSSRFPVPQKRSKQQQKLGEQKHQIGVNFAEWNLDNDIHERERQMRYLNYAKDLKQATKQARKEVINSQMKAKYGENCFNFMADLHDQIHLDLISCEQALINEANENRQTLADLDWNFILAAFYLAENQNFEEIQRLSFSLMTTCFAQWYQLYVLKQLSDNLEIDEFRESLETGEQIKLKVEEVIFARFVLISEVQGKQLDEPNLHMIMKYFSQKLDTLLQLERQILKNYEIQQIEFFSEIVFDFTSLHVMETLVQLISHKKITSEIKINVYILVNKYYKTYPQNVMSQTETDQKFDNFIAMYLKRFSTFIRFLNNLKIYQQLEPMEFNMLDSSLLFLSSLFWRENLSQQTVSIIMEVNITIAGKALTLGMAQKLIEFFEFHNKVLENFLNFYAMIKTVENLFKDRVFIDYFNTLLLEWHTLKLNSRNQGIQLKIDEQNTTEVVEFELFLILCLYITRIVTQTMQISSQENKYIKSIFQYAHLVYKKQTEILSKLQKSGFTLTSGHRMFVFAENVSIYLKLFSKSFEPIINPETCWRPIPATRCGDVEI